MEEKKFQIVLNGTERGTLVFWGLFQGKPLNSLRPQPETESSTPPWSGPTHEPLPLQVSTDTPVHSTVSPDAGQWTLG